MCHCLLVFLEKKLLAFLDLATTDKGVVGQGLLHTFSIGGTYLTFVTELKLD